MTRLQKKCLVGVAGSHLLVLVVLFCSGFITSSPKVDDTQVLNVIPSSVLDHVLNSGVQSPQTPPPAPAPPTPPTPPTPTPPVPTPPPPTPAPPTPPQPAKVTPVEPVPDKPDPTPDRVVKVKPTPPKIQVDLTPVVHKTTDTADAAAQQQREAERAAKRAAAKRLKAIQDAERNIETHSSSSTDVQLPGNSTASMANYASVVKTVYTQAWTPPDDASDDANVKVKVTIANDGHVVSARIIEPSGDSGLDQSVQRTLDRVTDLEPFPEGSTDKERTYIINFNLKAKRLLG